MRRPVGSLVRFAIVGAASNVALYLAYIAITAAGMGPKSAMTLCFVAGVMFAFALNRSWTFQSSSPVRRAFVRYAAIYVGGYLLNLLGLLVLVDWCGFRHEIVQGIMIVVVALVMFVAQRSWAFREQTEDSGAQSPRPVR